MLKRFSEEELLRKPLSEEQKQELLALMDMGDENIDTSDIPEITLPVYAVRGEAARREMVRRRRPDGQFPTPVYLSAELEDYLTAIANRRAVSLNDLVNDLLAKEIAIFETVK
jgi:hypothetical protein